MQSSSSSVLNCLINHHGNHQVWTYLTWNTARFVIWLRESSENMIVTDDRETETETEKDISNYQTVSAVASTLIDTASALQSFWSIKWRMKMQNNFPNRGIIYLCVPMFRGRNIPLDSIMQMWSLTVWGLTVVSSTAGSPLHQIIIFSFPGHRKSRYISTNLQQEYIILNNVITPPHPTSDTNIVTTWLCSVRKTNFSFLLFCFQFLVYFLVSRV